MLKLKCQYSDHVMLRADSLEKTLMLGGLRTGGERAIEDEMVGWHHRLNGYEFEQLWEIVKDRGAWRAALHWVAESQTRLSD